MKYKLVPIEPTQEMIDEGLTSRTHPRERYKAMLAAAPAVEQKPYAYEYGLDNGDGTFSVVINKGSFAQLKENEFGYLPPFDTASKEHPVTPLYLHPQPAPEIAKLVESLEVAHRFIANGIELGYIKMPDSDTLDPAPETLPAIEAALAEYRAQGGDV